MTRPCSYMLYNCVALSDTHTYRFRLSLRKYVPKDMSNWPNLDK